jgi:hypothetical protein
MKDMNQTAPMPTGANGVPGACNQQARIPSVRKCQVGNLWCP